MRPPHEGDGSRGRRAFTRGRGAIGVTESEAIEVLPPRIDALCRLAPVTLSLLRLSGRWKRRSPLPTRCAGASLQELIRNAARLGIRRFSGDAGDVQTRRSPAHPLG